MKKNEIAHTGTVIEINPDFTSIEITSSSACSACHAKGLCGMSEEQDKVVMLPTDPYTVYKVGDKVQVYTKMTMGLKAVWISYAIPLFILLILILSLSSVVGNEFLRGGIAIAGVGVYYIIIRLMRDKLSDQFEFYIKK